ncbi:lysine biosynthesis protein LysW [Chloroflexi bacterium TSY]|nr:lysine biosynthesis protein LysW [Chloroflexi bacterium TSY]
METVTGEANCTVCEAVVELVGVMQHEVTQCPECGIDLEVVEIHPLKLDLAPEEEEDWGE